MACSAVIGETKFWTQMFLGYVRYATHREPFLQIRAVVATGSTLAVAF